MLNWYPFVFCFARIFESEPINWIYMRKCMSLKVIHIKSYAIFELFSYFLWTELLPDIETTRLFHNRGLKDSTFESHGNQTTIKYMVVCVVHHHGYNTVAKLIWITNGMWLDPSFDEPILASNFLTPSSQCNRNYCPLPLLLWMKGIALKWKEVQTPYNKTLKDEWNTKKITKVGTRLYAHKNHSLIIWGFRSISFPTLTPAISILLG